MGAKRVSSAFVDPAVGPAGAGGAATRGQGQAAAAPSGPRPDAGGGRVRGAEQQRRSRPARGARSALRRDSAGRPQPTVRTWGAKPRAPAKHGYPRVRFGEAEVRAEGPQAIASSDGGAAPSAAPAEGRREASPHRRVAALCAAPPRAVRSTALEPAGREGGVRTAGGASSPSRPGGAALAASAQRCPGRCRPDCASSLTLAVDSAAGMEDRSELRPSRAIQVAVEEDRHEN
jgi:hypothetical protein